MPSSDPPRGDVTPAETVHQFRRWLSDQTSVLEPFRTEVAEDVEPAWQRYRPLQRLLWDHGWTRLGWPTEVGGAGGSALNRFVLHEELAAAGYVVPEIALAIEIIAPMLVRYAPDLAVRHLARGMGGDEVWCQGFSEPDAGSDLGSLRTRAVPDGDGWRLTGQKMWSSNGHIASWSCLLARTGDADSGYRGLTMFWVDLSDPAVRVVPTRLGSGRRDTSEIFLDDVHVPGERVIGEVGAGWPVVMYLLQFERGAYAWGRQAALHSALAELVHSHAEGFGTDADTVVGDAYLALFGLRSQASYTIGQLAAGRDLGPEISVDKILLSGTEQTITEAARKLLYPRLEVADDSDDYAGLWRSRWAYSRITTIYGGAVEVQRDLVSERLLGLPRGR